MGFFEFFGVLTFFYYLVSALLWLTLDSDIELFIKEKFGKSISSLRGQTVWITGASSGIGKQLAIVLAQNGVKLCISARRENELNNVKAECLNKSKILNDNDILILKMDMLDIDSHQLCFEKVLAHFGMINVLVNNAGRSQRANWEDIELTVDRELFELDVFSILNLSRIYVRYVERNNLPGNLVVTSSAAGLMIVPFSASYCGAKYAINAYFESLRMEKPHIGVTIFCPGPVFSNLLEHCFTNHKNTVYGKTMQPNDNRMTVERCSELMAIAIANRTGTSFVGPFPWQAMIYIWNYYPNIRKLLPVLLGHKGFMKLRESRSLNADSFKLKNKIN